MIGRLYTVVRGPHRILYREVATALPCFPSSIEIIRVDSHPLLKPLDPLIAWIQTPNKEEMREIGFTFASGVSFDIRSGTTPLVDYLR
jgi:hypothetical protein